MTIYPLGYGAAVRAIIVLTVPLVLCGLLVYAWIQPDVPSVANVLYVFLALGFVVMVVRMLRLPQQSWVTVGDGAVSWRTPERARYGASPSGWVPLAAVTSVAVVPREAEVRKGSALRGHAVRLTLTDGYQVVLPVWSSVARSAPALAELVDALRAAVRPDVPVVTVD